MKKTKESAFEKLMCLGCHHKEKGKSMLPYKGFVLPLSTTTTFKTSFLWKPILLTPPMCASPKRSNGHYWRMRLSWPKWFALLLLIPRPYGALILGRRSLTWFWGVAAAAASPCKGYGECDEEKHVMGAWRKRFQRRIWSWGRRMKSRGIQLLEFVPKESVSILKKL